MFISKLKITNFKSFTGEPTSLEFNMPNGEAGSGLNIFVGENNTGKSTIFEAIDFLRNGTKKDLEDIKNKHNQNEHANIELVFEGDVEKIIDNFSQPNKVGVFKKYIRDDNGSQSICFSRNTLNDAKAIKIWHEEDGEFKNEAGIDAPIKKIIRDKFCMV